MTPNLFRPVGPAVTVSVLAALLSCGSSVSAPGEDAEGGPSSVRSMRVVPDSAAVAPGERHRFSARGVEPDGDTVEVEAAWSATGGTVEDDGTFTAGDSLGTFAVSARIPSGPSDTARVRVREGEATGGGEDDGGGGGEEDDAGGGDPAAECDDPDPAWIWCDDFEEDRTDAYFEYSDAGGSFVRAEGVGVDGSAGMRTRFDEGQEGAGFLHLAFGRTPDPYFDPVDGGTEDHRDVYWRLWVRNEPDWTGGGGHKLSRATIFHDSDWSQAMAAPVWSGGTSPGWYHLVLDPKSGTDESGEVISDGYNDPDGRWLGAARGDTPLFDEAHVGRWYCVEARVRLNDPGVSNGVFELWIDGSLDARADGLNWVGSYTDHGINAVFVENYWNRGAPTSQERYVDRLVVSTEPIGC